MNKPRKTAAYILAWETDNKQDIQVQHVRCWQLLGRKINEEREIGRVELHLFEE